MHQKEKTKQLELYWRKHIAQLKCSQLSQKAYCTQHNLVDHQLRYWKKRIYLLDDRSKAKGPFAKVQVQLQPEASITKQQPRLTISLPSGVEMRVELDKSQDLIAIINKLANT